MERETLRIVVDTNEFIFALTGPADGASARFPELLLLSPARFEVRIPHVAATETVRNLPRTLRPQLHALLAELGQIDPDYVVPFEFGEQFRAAGMKVGDAMIAAYCRWTQADLLVSEKRHFLVEFRDRFPFRVINAATFLKEFASA